MGIIRFVTLGTLEVVHDGRPILITAPKVRNVLALFVLRANTVVRVDTLVEELWGDKPPRSAITTTQTYIYQLRKFFAHEFGMAGNEILATKDPGYVMHLGDQQVDVRQFMRLIGEGRALLESRDPYQASEVLGRALALWNGSALSNVDAGAVLEAHIAHLEEERIRALELRIEADLQLGRHRELIAELRNLTIAYPINEWFHSRLILALSRSGRRGEALAAYQNVRRILDNELGVGPSRELRKLQHEVLAADAV
ncbi:AfsR/SARP family transcriptional regulator [Nocardia arthritidis]|uniref:Transcriptional regulator n=1 Tax=Nocardia arthritidis TaxID=228602 RepID=A0A6G9YAF0_9NOCA|nr:AfsR/SARP family transcriptional regulator [Nocardia arthritidis]QIS10057.1 transcriptional regulator [Nocardia arthritidis]